MEQERNDYATNLADLTEALNSLDVENLSIAQIEEFFSGYEDSEESLRIKNNLLSIKQLREEYPSDRDLARAVLGFRLIGPFKIKLNSFALCLYLPNWIDFNRAYGRIFHSAKGFQSSLRINIGGHEKIIQIAVMSSINSKPTEVHEIRHATNHSLKAVADIEGKYHRTAKKDKSSSNAQMISDLDEVIKGSPDRVNALIEYFNKMNIRMFRNELLAQMSDFSPSGASSFQKNLEKSLAGPDYTERNEGIDKEIIRILKSSFDFTDEEITEINRGLITPGRNEVQKAINATQTLLSKGYSQTWILSYLAIGENFLGDWEEIANKTPESKKAA